MSVGETNLPRTHPVKTDTLNRHVNSTKHHTLSEACVDDQEVEMVRKKTARQWWKNLYRESAEVAPDTYYTLQIGEKDKAEREFDQVQLHSEKRKKVCVLPLWYNLKVLQECVYVTQ